MFCFKCGAPMPDTALACPQCKAAVTAAPPPAAPAPAAAAAPAPAQGAQWLNIPRAQVYTGPQQTDGKAVGSLILGILAMFPLGLLAGIPAVILGHLSRKSIRESLGRLKGDGMALAGLIMGYLSVAAIPMILIIAAIAIPNLLRARMAANESAATSTVRTLNTAQVTYSMTYPTAGYARDLATLGSGASASCTGEGSADHACLIDNTLACGGSWCVKNGYRYSLTAVCEAGAACTDYLVVAMPVQPGSSGSKSFCSTADAVIRAKPAGIAVAPATAAQCQLWDPII